MARRAEIELIDEPEELEAEAIEEIEPDDSPIALPAGCVGVSCVESLTLPAFGGAAIELVAGEEVPVDAELWAVLARQIGVCMLVSRGAITVRGS